MHFSRPLPRPSNGKHYPRAVLRCSYHAVLANGVTHGRSPDRLLGCRELPPAGCPASAQVLCLRSKRWLRPMESHHHLRVQSPACYGYTRPESKWSDRRGLHARPLRPERSALLPELRPEKWTCWRRFHPHARFPRLAGRLLLINRVKMVGDRGVAPRDACMSGRCRHWLARHPN